jgi:hypothetical protein
MLRILPSVAEKVVYLAFETRASNCSFEAMAALRKEHLMINENKGTALIAGASSDNRRDHLEKSRV